jgi:hypothetical protein
VTMTNLINKKFKIDFLSLLFSIQSFFWGAKDPTQGLAHARQVSSILSPPFSLLVTSDGKFPLCMDCLEYSGTYQWGWLKL